MRKFGGEFKVDDNGNKVLKCSYCGAVKTLDNFYNSKVSGTGKSSACKECLYKKEKERIKITGNIYKEKRRNSAIKLRYGIDQEQYNELLKLQKNKCYICGCLLEEIKNYKPNGFSAIHFCIDHDHKNGIIRGLLCRDCNLGISKLKEDVSILNRAIKYLKLDTDNEHKKYITYLNNNYAKKDI